MLTFFRRIRLSLFAEKRVSRYFLYALGEILLVVIGILIALQANNWNENRKTLIAIEETRQALLGELEGHILDTERAMSIGHKKARALDALRKREYDQEMDLDFGSFYGDFNLFDTFTFDLRHENLDKWIAFEKDLPTKYEDVIWIAKQLKHLMAERKDWEILATDLSTSRFKEFADELAWFYEDDSLAIQKRKDYFKNDPFFRNKAIHYLDFQLNENVFYTTQVRSWTQVLLWRMIEENRGNSAVAMQTFLEEFEYRPFEAVVCGETPYTPAEFIGFRKSFLVYNASDETRIFSVVNEKGTKKRTFNPPANGLFPIVMYPGDFLQIGTDCQELYSPVNRGYHIIK